MGHDLAVIIVLAIAMLGLGYFTRTKSHSHPVPKTAPAKAPVRKPGSTTIDFRGISQRILFDKVEDAITANKVLRAGHTLTASKPDFVGDYSVVVTLHDEEVGWSGPVFEYYIRPDKLI